MKQHNGYPARVQRVVEYLAEHLDDTLTLDTLARVAHFSPYHFHRIYRGLLGETITDTVRRLRLHRSAVELLDRDISIERVARRAGYSSQAAFTRAFHSEYGEPPARYRGVHGATNPTAYAVEMIDLPVLRVAAVQQRGDYQFSSKAFERLMTAAATTGLLGPATRTIGIFNGDPVVVPPEELITMACITVPDEWQPSGDLVEAHIAGGRYARIVHVGSYAELKTAYDWLYQTWLPESGEEPRDLPCVEEYLNDARQVAPKDLETAVMMPLEG